MSLNSIESQLKGGHPNSLGNTVEVVDSVVSSESSLEDLFACYKSNDEVVRLRVSNAMKRIAKARKTLLLPYLDRFIDEIGELDQASAQWTLAQLFLVYTEDLSGDQHEAALKIMKRNLENHSDWIVLNQTMKTLTEWSKWDENLKEWLIPRLKTLSTDDRKSVAKTSSKCLAGLSA